MSGDAAATPLKFESYSSNVDMSFWHELTKRKLDVYGLSDAPVDVWGVWHRMDEGVTGGAALLTSVCRSLQHARGRPRSAVVVARDTGQLWGGALDSGGVGGVGCVRQWIIGRVAAVAVTDAVCVCVCCVFVCGLGTLINTNTSEDFAGLDRKAILQRTLDRMVCTFGDIQPSNKTHTVTLDRHAQVADMASGAAENDPRMLQRFLCLCYADLKRYKFVYWFCFPTLTVPGSTLTLTQPAQPLSTYLGARVRSHC